MRKDYLSAFLFGKTEFLDRHWRNQYIPIFHLSNIALTPAQAANLLHRSGFLSQPIDLASQDLASQPACLKVASQQVQMRLRVPPTGELDAETALLLSGQFLDRAFRLDRMMTIKPS